MQAKPASTTKISGVPESITTGSINPLPIVVSARLLQQLAEPLQVPVPIPPAYSVILPPAYTSAPHANLPVYPPPPNLSITTYYPATETDYPNPYSRPCICSDVYQLICGSDGITYSNSCWAACESVLDFTVGACPWAHTPIAVRCATSGRKPISHWCFWLLQRCWHDIPRLYTKTWPHMGFRH